MAHEIPIQMKDQVVQEILRALNQLDSIHAPSNAASAY